MLSYLAPVAAGNAVQILVAPPAGSARWRILRKLTDDIAGADDPDANVVYDGNEDKFVIDTFELVNGTAYFYQAFDLVSSAWVASASRSVTPASSFTDLAPGVLDIVRERLDLGFASYVARSILVHPDNHIPTLLATPAFEDAVFPLTTVHQMLDAQAERFVGEELLPSIGYPDDDEVGDTDGWLSRYQILIICWCVNGDQRNDMRRALKAIVVANLPVFEYAGMTQVEVQFSDADDMNTYEVPMYQSTCTLTCVAPTAIETRYPVVHHVVAGSGSVPTDEEETPVETPVVVSVCDCS